MRDNKLILKLMLKNTFTIGKLTLLFRQFLNCFCLQIYTNNLRNTSARLLSIRSNIWNRTRTYSPRNINQILNPTKPSLSCPIYKIIPRFASSNLNFQTCFIFREDLKSRDLHLYNNPIKCLSTKKRVCTSSKYPMLTLIPKWSFNKIQKLIGRSNWHKITGNTVRFKCCKGF